MFAKKRTDVTIIVPVYNTEKLLRRCVDSLVSQTWPYVEILLINDGSTDSSGMICDEYGIAYEQVKVVHKKNEGVSSTRNLGIDLAQGKYILFVDSDDVVHPQMVELYMLAAEDQSVLVCGYTKSEEELKKFCADGWRERVIVYERQEFLAFMKNEYVNAPWNKCYDTRILRMYHIRFDEKKSLGEDFLFNLDYFQRAPGRYKIISCPLYYYEEGREGSLANAFSPQLFDLQVEMFQRLYSFMLECHIWNTCSQKEYFQLYWNRLYLVMRIFLAYRKEGMYPQQVENMFLEALESPVWKKVWREYVRSGRVAMKDKIKYLHVEYLKWKYRMKRK